MHARHTPAITVNVTAACASIYSHLITIKDLFPRPPDLPRRGSQHLELIYSIVTKIADPHPLLIKLSQTSTTRIPLLSGPVMDIESTMKPARVAQLLVESAIAKHRDRYENVFMKAVSSTRIVKRL